MAAARSLPSRIVGVIDDSGRLPGWMALASSPISPKAFGTPGFTEKSSISLLSTKPVPGTTNAAPKGRFTLWVTAAMFPSLSMIEKCEVSLPSGPALIPGNASLGVALRVWIAARNPAA